MIYAHQGICLGEQEVQTPLGFWDTNRSPNLSQRIKPFNNRQKKKTCRIMDFAVPDDQLKETERKRRARLVPSDGDSNCNQSSWYSHQRIDTGSGGLGNKGTSGDNPSYSIIKICQNTKESHSAPSGKLSANAGVKKTRKGVNIN